MLNVTTACPNRFAIVGHFSTTNLSHIFPFSTLFPNQESTGQGGQRKKAFVWSTSYVQYESDSREGKGRCCWLGGRN